MLLYHEYKFIGNTQLVDGTVQQMLCIPNMNLKQYARYTQMFLKQVNLNYASTVFSHFSLNLGEGECDEHDKSNFEILLFFEEAIVTE